MPGTCWSWWSGWGGIHRRGGRPGRGAAAGQGSSGRTLPSCRYSQPGVLVGEEVDFGIDGSDVQMPSHLNPSITVVGGNYPILDEHKVDGATGLPPAEGTLYGRISLPAVSGALSMYMVLRSSKHRHLHTKNQQSAPHTISVSQNKIFLILAKPLLAQNISHIGNSCIRAGRDVCPVCHVTMS